jgi:hypothetical protein
VPYISEAERKAASQMTWSEILTHVKQAEQCEEPEARRHIGNAIEDGVLKARWEDERFRWGSSSPIHIPDDAPPRDADYWVNCKTDRKHPDSVREPPPYERGLVSRRRAKQLDKTRRFRAPLFPRQLVLKFWPQPHRATTAVTQKHAIAFLTGLLRTDGNMKRDAARAACQEKFPKLSERGFRFTVWPEARANAGLERSGRRGRKPMRS